MSKTAGKDTEQEAPAFAAFDAAKATDQFRAFAEKGVEQSQQAYAKMKSNVETAQKTLESTLETAREANSQLSLKAIAAMNANSQAGFAHLEALVGVRSLSELIELQTTFMRKSVEMAVDQAKELQSISTKAAEDVSAPIKQAFEQAVRELKAA